MYGECCYRNSPTGIQNVLLTLMENYPVYMQQPDRLKKIMDMYTTDGDITLLIEDEYVDRQFRDSYYSYFSQKFRDIPRNCVRLIFFEGATPETLKSIRSRDFADKLIGMITLRPLKIGNIGLTLLNPKKLKVNGYVQVCKFKTMVYGRRMTIEAFPFLSQDNDSMTCAETSLFSLMQYYGEKYSEYRVLMPSEILTILQTASYQRVLPSTGVDDCCMAKVLSESHFYPRLYSGEDDFDFLLHTYVESGIPFILGLPRHAVICIGHGPVDLELKSHDIDSVVEKIFVGPDDALQEQYILNTSQLVDEYIFMDDNQEPYVSMSVNEITMRYYEQTDAYEFLLNALVERYATEQGLETELSEIEWESTIVEGEDGNYLRLGDWLTDVKYVSYEENDGIKAEFKPEAIERIKKKHNALLVPLYRRIFLDAPGARSIFEEAFLCAPPFIDEIRDTYQDPTWGKTGNNPIVWRMYLASSNSYREKRVDSLLKAGRFEIAEVYEQASLPRFLWVMEMGTLETLKRGQARVEVILDATASQNASSHGILIVSYLNHYVYAPNVRKEAPNIDGHVFEEIQKKMKDSCVNDAILEEIAKKFSREPLTAIFRALYTSNAPFPETFDIFCNHNLKETKP